MTNNLHLFVTQNGNCVSTQNLVKTFNIQNIYNQVTKEMSLLAKEKQIIDEAHNDLLKSFGYDNNEGPQK